MPPALSPFRDHSEDKRNKITEENRNEGKEFYLKIRNARWKAVEFDLFHWRQTRGRT
jgi:hypothetical protein